MATIINREFRQVKLSPITPLNKLKINLFYFSTLNFGRVLSVLRLNIGQMICRVYLLLRFYS